MSLPDAIWQAALRRRLLAWYRKAARDLPWRRDRDPYRVWVSEIMLQQTQVATVKPYFERFIARFPNAASLAAANEQQVLRLWEGLGYYRRARQLHQAARRIVAEHAGEFPRDFESVLALPGIGRYTAGAILSIAFDQRRPILEANTIRLIARLLAYRGDTASGQGQRLLWSFAEAILPSQKVGAFNQALMELGSLVCTPRAPSCDACPLQELCPTQIGGWQDEIPAPKRRAAVEEVRQAAVVIHRNGQVLLRQCQADERWAGMWDFPRFEVSSASGEDLRAEVIAKAHAMTAMKISLGEQFTAIRHGVTRFRITLRCYEAKVAKKASLEQSAGEIRWCAWDELPSLPLSVTARKLAKLASERFAGSGSSR